MGGLPPPFGVKFRGMTPRVGSSPAAPTTEAVRFVLRLGRAFHICGYPAHRVEQVMGQAAALVGIEGQFFTTPTVIIASFGSDDQPSTHLLRIEPGDMHLERLNRLDEVLMAVRTKRLTPAEALSEVDHIITSQPRFGALLTTLAYGLASAASGRILGAGANGVVVAAVIGVVVGVLIQLAGTRLALGRVLVPLAAFVASTLAALAAHFVQPMSLHIVTLAGIIILLPGLALTVAMTEVSTNHLVSGTARLTGAIVTFIALAFGVAMGRTVVELGLGPVTAGFPVPLSPWSEWLAVLVSPLAFLVLLRAPARDAGWILGVGVLTFLGGRLGAHVLGPELGVLVGAFSAGAASNLYGRFQGRSPAVTLVPSLLLLVPGSVGFSSLAAVLDRQILNGVDAAFRGVLMVSALVAGLLLANITAPSER